MATPQAWVGCLACYNDGRLIGDWVPGAEADEYTPCSRPGHEEWWVFDHTDYGGLLVGECSPIEAAERARMLDTASEDDREAFLAWINDQGPDHADYSAFRDAFEGEYDSERAFAESILDANPEFEPDSTLGRYFDYDAFTRDLFLSDYTTAQSQGGVFVWRNA